MRVSRRPPVLQKRSAEGCAPDCGATTFAPLSKRPASLVAAALLISSSPGCAGIIGSAITSGEGGGFGAQDDIEFVGEAVPFGLMLIETLLADDPEHEGLLLAATSGFTQYAVAFVVREAERQDEKDPARATELRARAKRLLKRARLYGLRGLEEEYTGFAAGIAGTPAERAELLDRVDDPPDDVPLLYWTAAAWFSQISLSKDDLRVVGDQPVAEALMAKALALDPDWGDGAIHEFYVTYDTARGEATGGSRKRAQEHLDRVVALTGGRKIGVYVTWAENVCVQDQDKKCFHEQLDRALAFDADSAPEHRLVNLIAQEKARRLLAAKGDLFLEE